MVQVHELERRPPARWIGEQGQAYVVDGHTVAGAALRRPSMRVPVKDHAHGIAEERLLEPARAEEREDLRRLALDRVAHGRIVERDHLPGGAKLGQGRPELERPVDGLVDEALHDLLAPALERAPPEPPSGA